MNDLPQLASLLKSRNTIDYKIATIIGRPTQVQSVGEYIASVIFGITLTGETMVHKSSDGRFERGPLAGKTVDVQWRTKHDGILHLKTDPLPDYYLVFVGSKEATALHSRCAVRDWNQYYRAVVGTSRDLSGAEEQSTGTFQ